MVLCQLQYAPSAQISSHYNNMFFIRRWHIIALVCTYIFVLLSLVKIKLVCRQKYKNKINHQLTKKISRYLIIPLIFYIVKW